jgi:membrane protease YdiL (CAAX protease family)
MLKPHFQKPPSFVLLLVFFLTLAVIYFLLGFFQRPELTSPAQVVVFLLPSLLFMRHFDLRHAFERKHLAIEALLIFTFTLALSYSLNEILPFWFQIFPIPKEMEELFDLMMHANSPYGIFWDILSFALVPAICEEIFFRGILQTGLMQKLNPATAILVTALVFAAYHFNPWFFPFYFVLGALFGFFYYRTRNLALAMLAHFTNNALGILLYYKTGH